MKYLFLATAFFLLLPVHHGSAESLPFSAYTEQSPFITVKASWQRFGMDLPDKLSDDMVRREIDSFRALAGQTQKELQDTIGNNGSRPNSCPYEMYLEGKISNSGKVSGILWKNYQYLGGAHGNLSLSSRSYSMADGRPVLLKDLFYLPQKALALISKLSEKELLLRGLPESMVKPGTMPEEKNFSVFLLEPEGLTIYFEPYQVAPWSEGTIMVTLPLKALSPAKPRMEYWP